jgi:hypothetical protein
MVAPVVVVVALATHLQRVMAGLVVAAVVAELHPVVVLVGSVAVVVAQTPALEALAVMVAAVVVATR